MNRIKISSTSSSSIMSLTSVLVTLVYLSVAIVTADVPSPNRIQKNISRDFENAVDTIFLNGELEYSNFTSNAEYVSEVEFHPDGMAGFYKIIGVFMDLILPKDMIPKDVKLVDLQLETLPQQWPTFLNHYAILLSITVIGILFAVLMPLCGLYYCCYRCFGTRSQPLNNKYDMFCKLFFATFLIVVVILLLLSVVCAFINNHRLQEGENELPANLDNSIKDIHTFINSTNTHLGVLLVKNYKELNEYLVTITNKTCNVISNFFTTGLFPHINLFVNGLNNVQTDLLIIENITADLRIKLSELNGGLQQIKHELRQMYDECNKENLENCKAINEITNLKTVEFDPNITNEVENFKKQINKINIPEKINIRSSMQEIDPQLKRVDDEINKTYSEMTNVLKTVDEKITNNTNLQQIDFYIQKYSVYRYYISLFMCLIVLFLILIIIFGLICGICGKKTDAYYNDCCNKRSGSRVLRLGVIAMFFFSFFLIIITLVLFLSGTVLKKFVCDTFRNNNKDNNNQIFKLIDKEFKLENSVESINSCHANKSVCVVLNLEYKINVSSYEEKLNNFVKNITVEDKKIKILDETTKDQINSLKNLSFAHFYKFGKDLQNNLTNLDELVAKLTKFRQNITSKVNKNLIALIIRNEIYLKMYQRTLVSPILTAVDVFKDKVKKINETLKFNQTKFEDAINITLEEIQNVQNYINDNLNEDMKKITEKIITKIKHFLKKLEYASNNNIGQCGPLSNVYNQTLTSICDKILKPWNGFWMSMALCIILFVPTLILSIKLSSLFEKSDSFEREYLYNRDTNPLNLESKRRESLATPSSGSLRYADMARKQWEGKPNEETHLQYQSGPRAGRIEYERPPPYYYPGL